MNAETGFWFPAQCVNNANIDFGRTGDMMALDVDILPVPLRVVVR
jgi:hypothetical protein